MMKPEWLDWRTWWNVPGFVVRCGTTNVQIGDAFDSEPAAYACAVWHARVHACTPWIEPPLATVP